MNRSDRPIFRYSSTELWPAVSKKIDSNAEVVLDIGCGIVPMAFFRPKLHILMEPWKEYSDVLMQRHRGDKSILIIRQNAIDGLRSLADKSVDSIFMLDVIEHMPKDVGFAVLEQSMRVARSQIIVFTPLGFMVQHSEYAGEKDAWGMNGTDVQAHVSGWNPEDFQGPYEFHVCADFHKEDFRGRRLDQPFGAFFAICNLQLPESNDLAALPDIRRPLPSELKLQECMDLCAQLKKENLQMRGRLMPSPQSAVEPSTSQTGEIAESDFLQPAHKNIGPEDIGGAVRFHPLVSIVIPVFNGRNYLGQAIESALDQIYDNCEIIVVNDGSTDKGDTERIALSYGDRVRYFSKPNGGVASALNYGIDRMKGEYFSWLSHDDIYERNKISAQVSYLEAAADKRTILYSNYSLIDASSNITGVVDISVNHSRYKTAIPLYPIVNGLIHGCSLLIHRQLLSLAGKFDEDLRTTQDYDLWYRLFPNCSIHHQNQALIRSRVHPEQDSKRHKDTSRETNALWIKMISNCPTAQMLLMEGSVSSFLKKAIRITDEAGYQIAADHARRALKEHLDIKSRIGDKKVSIIIPFYNRIGLLVEAIQSALIQTHSNIEIIAINDSSSDSTAPILDLARKSPGKLKIIDNQRSRGASGARNYGVLQATGDYIAFLDSDDLFMPTKIDEQLRFMIENDFSITYTSYVSFDGEETTPHPATAIYSFPESACAAIATPTVMLRRELLRELKFSFDESMKIGEDMCLWIDISKYFNIHPFQRPLSMVRLHGANAAYDPAKLTHGVINILKHIGSIDNIRSHPDVPTKLATIIMKSLVTISEQQKGASNQVLMPIPSIDPEQSRCNFESNKSAPSSFIPAADPSNQSMKPILTLTPREIKFVNLSRKLAGFTLARVVFRLALRPCYRSLRFVYRLARTKNSH